MNSDIVIFGASGGGVKVAQTLKSFGIDFYCFVDNDEKKWGNVVYEVNKSIFSPEILNKSNFKIIIASEHQNEIEEQLDKMKQLFNLVLKEDFIFPYIEQMAETLKNEFIKKEDYYDNICHKKNKIVIDLAEGVQIGGIETWTYTVARELTNLGIDTEIFAKKTVMLPPEDIKKCFTYLDIDYNNFKENVYQLAKEIIKRGSCSVIINKHTQILYAAYLAQKVLGAENIKIISIIHNDSIVLYRRQKYLENITDIIFCVSSRIMKKLVNVYKINKYKVYHKESPVYFEMELYRKYTLDNKQPVKIGYAARLVKMQKRADRLIEFINLLEEIKCLYHFTIAGDGAYKKILQEYISQNNLSEKVSLIGQITKEGVDKLWKDMDIYISVSDFEGSSISLLEAMSNGVVPLVTDVSGADDFISQGKTGYIFKQNNIRGMAETVKKMDFDRMKMQHIGENARKIIINKCVPREYGKYIASLCGMEK